MSATLADHASLEAVSEEWAALHNRARPGTAFEHPAWIGAWAQHFVPDGQLHVVTVRRDGRLVAVAPLYHRRWLLPGGPRSLQPLGTGHHQTLTEVVQVLAEPDEGPAALRALVTELEGHPGWDWLHLSLGPQQGWLVPQWFDRPDAATILHRQTRACVVMSSLTADRVALSGRLRRNVRESVRRARNRSARFGGIRLLSVEDGVAFESAVESVFALHTSRADMAGKVTHRNSVADPASRAFVRDALHGLAKAGLARVHLVQHDGRAVAGLVVLSDGDTDYLCLSGLEPGYWDLSLNTLLVHEALVRSGELGRSAMNFSSGPDTAKLRWSRELALYQDFAVARTTVRSRTAHAVFSHAQLAAERRAARARHASFRP